MNTIEIFNNTNENIEEISIMKKVLEKALKKEKIKNLTFNIILVDNDYIHKINKEYRNIDRETDVITFALEDENTVQLPNSDRVLGDIYISLDKAKSQSIEYGHSFERELCFLAVHGFYHLLGYDHQTKEEEKEMFQKQEEVLEEYDIRREKDKQN